MSIEYKITALTAAIERLIAALDKTSQPPRHWSSSPLPLP